MTPRSSHDPQHRPGICGLCDSERHRPTSEPCTECDGTGQIRDRGIMETCHRCHGIGSTFPGEQDGIKLVKLDPADVGRCLYCAGTGEIFEHHPNSPTTTKPCTICNGTGTKKPATGYFTWQGGIPRPVHLDPDPATIYTPEEPAMETTLRYTTHRHLTRKDLAAFIAEVPDDATIQVRVNTPHPMERGTTTTTLEATWTTGKDRNA